MVLRPPTSTGDSRETRIPQTLVMLVYSSGPSVRAKDEKVDPWVRHPGENGHINHPVLEKGPGGPEEKS